jgi:hypothetical protein
LDGGIDVRNTTQTSRIGDQDFSSNTLRETVFLRQRFPLHNKLMIEADGRWLRDTIGSSLNGLSQESEQRTLLGNLRLSYRTRPMTVAVKGNWFNRILSDAMTQLSQINRSDYDAWLKARPSARTLLRASVAQRLARRTGETERNTESRERSGSLSADYHSKVGEFRYRLLGNSSEAVLQHRRQKLLTNRIVEAPGLHVTGWVSRSESARTSSTRAPRPANLRKTSFFWTRSPEESDSTILPKSMTLSRRM